MLRKPRRLIDRELLDTFHTMKCAACSVVGCDPAHIKSKGSGGEDLIHNLLPLCRKHHTEQHTIGWKSMVQKHYSVWVELYFKGWRFDKHGRLSRIDKPEEKEDGKTDCA